MEKSTIETEVEPDSAVKSPKSDLTNELPHERPSAKTSPSPIRDADVTAPVSKQDSSLPAEQPPLPDELPPQETSKDDGWAPVWDENAQAFYFHNSFTQVSQWENPRVPEASEVLPTAPGVSQTAPQLPSEPPPTSTRPAGGYDPSIHGDYDPNAWYAQEQDPAPSSYSIGTGADALEDPAAAYTATGAFNRFTGRWQAADVGPENHNDENKSRRQMNAFFDVDSAANNHDGRSLKAERSGKKLSRSEVKGFKEKRRAKKEEKRRAWLMD